MKILVFAPAALVAVVLFASVLPLSFGQTKPHLSQINGGKLTGLVFIDADGKLQPVTVDASTLLLTNTGTGWKLTVVSVPTNNLPVLVPNVDPVRQATGSYLVSDISVNIKTVQVYRNGVLQRPVSDYTAVSGTVGGVIITPVGDAWLSTDTILLSYQRL